MFVHEQNMDLNSLITLLSVGAQNTNEIKGDGKDFASCLALSLSENGKIGFVSQSQGNGEISPIHKAGETSLPIILKNVEQNASGQGYGMEVDLVVQGEDAQTVSVPARIIPLKNSENNITSLLILITDYQLHNKTENIHIPVNREFNFTKDELHNEIENIHIPIENPELSNDTVVTNSVAGKNDAELLPDMDTAISGEGVRILHENREMHEPAEGAVPLVSFQQVQGETVHNAPLEMNGNTVQSSFEDTVQVEDWIPLEPGTIFQGKNALAENGDCNSTTLSISDTTTLKNIKNLVNTIEKYTPEIVISPEGDYIVTRISAQGMEIETAGENSDTPRFVMHISGNKTPLIVQSQDTVPERSLFELFDKLASSGEKIEIAIVLQSDTLMPIESGTNIKQDTIEPFLSNQPKLISDESKVTLFENRSRYIFNTEKAQQIQIKDLSLSQEMPNSENDSIKIEYNTIKYSIEYPNSTGVDHTVIHQNPENTLQVDMQRVTGDLTEQTEFAKYTGKQPVAEIVQNEVVSEMAEGNPEEIQVSAGKVMVGSDTSFNEVNHKASVETSMEDVKPAGTPQGQIHHQVDVDPGEHKIDNHQFAGKQVAGEPVPENSQKSGMTLQMAQGSRIAGENISEMVFTVDKTVDNTGGQEKNGEIKVFHSSYAEPVSEAETVVMSDKQGGNFRMVTEDISGKAGEKGNSLEGSSYSAVRPVNGEQISENESSGWVLKTNSELMSRTENSEVRYQDTQTAKVNSLPAIESPQEHDIQNTNGKEFKVYTRVETVSEKNSNEMIYPNVSAATKGDFSDTEQTTIPHIEAEYRDGVHPASITIENVSRGYHETHGRNDTVPQTDTTNALSDAQSQNTAWLNNGDMSGQGAFQKDSDIMYPDGMKNVTDFEISTDNNISNGALESPEQLSGIVPGSLENPDIPVIGMKPADSGREVFQGEMDEKQVLNSIVRQARFMYQKGLSSAVINLEPPNLGRMKLDIITENSKVTGRIIVESAEVKQLIQNSISELRENLAQSGMKVESFDVQVGHNSGTDSWANRENLENQLDAQQKSAVFSGNVSDPNMQPNIENKPIRTTSLYCEILDVRI